MGNERRELDGLRVFLYVLVRDHLPFGTVEEIMLRHVDPSTGKPLVFSEHDQASWADGMAVRIVPTPAQLKVDREYAKLEKHGVHTEPEYPPGMKRP